MSLVENRQSEGLPKSGLQDRLDSWKSIAAYLGRGVRTVQRWEREEGLPVHRLAHEKRGSVYARKEEIDAWWESRRVELAAEPPEESVPSAAPRLERITWASAATLWPALSSDGRFVAYVSDAGQDGTSPQIWLHQIGGAAVCLTKGEAERSHLSFVADDTRLVYLSSDATGQHVYAIPTLGGEPRLLKRNASACRPSPNGKWLAYVSLDAPTGVHITPLEGGHERVVGTHLTDVGFVVWSPDTKHLLVHAHEHAEMELDYWIVAADGSSARNTGIVRSLRERGLFPLTPPVAWVGDSLVFSLITTEGVGLWRLQLSPSLESSGNAERITRGTELDVFPTAGPDRVAFVSTHPDQNLWSVEIDPASGMARGAVRRLTRGPGFVAQLSVSSDGRTLAYFRARRAATGPVLRDLVTGAEAVFAPADDHGFPALSPSGCQLATGGRPGATGARAMRPIFVATVSDGATRQLSDDSGARPREWLDERLLVVERFGSRRHTVAILDTVTGEQHELLADPAQSVSNPRLSPDRRWIAFDATPPGGRSALFVARVRVGEAIHRDDWVSVEPRASHPFWSADGRFLYWLPTSPSTEFRNVVRARRFDGDASPALGETFVAFASSEMVVPAGLAGMAPVATGDQIVMVLGDFRGDVWTLDLA
jgi:Tol biopolymer transport system component